MTAGRPPDAAPGAAPGAARERTWLAWGRTVLAATVVTLLFLRLAGPGVALAAPVWLLVLAVARRRVTALRHAREHPVGRDLALVALAVTTLAVFGTALAVLP